MHHSIYVHLPIPNCFSGFNPIYCVDITLETQPSVFSRETELIRPGK